MNGMTPLAALKEFKFVEETTKPTEKSVPVILKSFEEAIYSLRFLKAIQMYRSRMWIFVNSEVWLHSA